MTFMDSADYHLIWRHEDGAGGGWWVMMGDERTAGLLGAAGVGEWRACASRRIKREEKLVVKQSVLRLVLVGKSCLSKQSGLEHVGYVYVCVSMDGSVSLDSTVAEQPRRAHQGHHGKTAIGHPQAGSQEGAATAGGRSRACRTTHRLADDPASLLLSRRRPFPLDEAREWGIRNDR